MAKQSASKEAQSEGTEAPAAVKPDAIKEAIAELTQKSASHKRCNDCRGKMQRPDGTRCSTCAGSGIEPEATGKSRHMNLVQK